MINFIILKEMIETHWKRSKLCDTPRTKYECELCAYAFDPLTRRPYSLVPCGHTLCVKCVEQLSRTACPFCRVFFDWRVPNWEIMKHLPKPVLPVLYNYLAVRLGDPRPLQEYADLVAEIHGLSSSLDRLVRKLFLRTATSGQHADTNNEQQQQRKLASFGAELKDYQAQARDCRQGFEREFAELKRQLEADENKYCEANLRELKQRLDALLVGLDGSKQALRGANEQFARLLASSGGDSRPAVVGRESVSAMVFRIGTELGDVRRKKVAIGTFKFLSSNTVKPTAATNENTTLSTAISLIEESLENQTLKIERNLI